MPPRMGAIHPRSMRSGWRGFPLQAMGRMVAGRSGLAQALTPMLPGSGRRYAPSHDPIWKESRRPAARRSHMG